MNATILHLCSDVLKMALSIRNQETERLAETLAELTGETKTAAVTKAQRDRLARLKREGSKRALAEELDAIAERCASLPIRDRRPAEEIVGYDDRGVPS